jgi:hypothetical protein
VHPDPDQDAEDGDEPDRVVGQLAPRDVEQRMDEDQDR